jgi:soluble lytic murein transglycosylase-like protein
MMPLHLRLPLRTAVVLLTVLCFAPAAVGTADREPVSRAAPPPNAVHVLFRAVSGCRPSLPERDRWRIAGVIHRESQRHGYDPLFVVALAEVESSCSPTARGRNGIGLIQVSASTARAMAVEVGLPWQGASMLSRPAFNVHLGLRYLSQLEQRFRDPRLAIAAYNLGPKRVRRMPAHRARNTRYVHKVISRYEQLVALHAAGQRSASARDDS